MNAFHLEIAEFVLMCHVDIRMLALHKFHPAKRFNGGVVALCLYTDLRTLAIIDIYVYAQISMHNKISIGLYPRVALYKVRDQVCSHFSADCGGLSSSF